MYIKRDLEKVVLEISKQFPALLVTGPRQVGKTTMLQKLMEGTDRKYVTLDVLSDRALAKTDPAMFLQKYKPPVLIDEIQYAPELFTYIKIHVDKSKQPGAFWLTGSQIFSLMHGVQESLAGRVAILRLSTLSQNEIFNHLENPKFTLDFDDLMERQTNIKNADTMQIFERIFNGGMPAIISGESQSRDIFYGSYLSTYIDRDIRELSGDIDSLSFFRFITAAAGRIGNILNVADIARDAEIKEVTAKQWLGILETLGLIFYLHPYSNNTLKRTIKAPKLYFYDTGLVSYLAKWSDAATLEAGAMNGAFFENYVVSELMKSYDNSGNRHYLNYYRDKDAKEIDIVIEQNGQLFPIEIKKSATPSKRMVGAFKVLEKGALPIGVGALFCMAEAFSAFDRENYIVPVSLI